MIGEVADLARGAIGDLVDVLAVLQHDVAAPDADALAIAEPLELEVLGRAVAPHPQHLEGHAHAIAEAVPVVGGEVAQDAALDVVAFHLDHDALGDREHAVGRDGDGGMEVDHPLERRHRHGPERAKEGEQLHKVTFTGARSAVSKNGIGWKRKAFAMMTSGNDSMRVTYCCTAPL